MKRAGGATVWVYLSGLPNGAQTDEKRSRPMSTVIGATFMNQLPRNEAARKTR